MKSSGTVENASRQDNKNKSVQQAKLFLRYVNDIVTVKGDFEKVLRAANLLHPNLHFTLETPNTNRKLAFLDLKITKTGTVTVAGIKNQQIQVPY